MRADPSILSLQPEPILKRPALTPPTPFAPQHEILVIEAEPVAAAHVAALRREYRVVTTTNRAVAIQHLNKTPLALVVADIDGDGDAGIDICRTAKSLRTPATVLITTSEAASVPDVLIAGCDAILLKPFAENLLFARIGRLLRTRGEQLRLRARRADDASDPARPESPLATTNRTWPNTACPSCAHPDAVSFEFSSYRRSWYACLACKQVWIGKRQE